MTRKASDYLLRIVGNTMSTDSGGGWLSLSGSNFTGESVVLWNGLACETVFVTSSALNVRIVLGNDAKEGTALISVANPAPNAAISSAVPVAVQSGTPVVTITAASVSDAADGSGNYVLALTGTDFVTSSTVEWNGASLTTTYVSPWQISAVITASDYNSLPAKVAVTNPAGISRIFEWP